MHKRNMLKIWYKFIAVLNPVINVKLSAAQRAIAGKNTSGQFGYYRRHVLIRFITRAEQIMFVLKKYKHLRRLGK